MRSSVSLCLLFDLLWLEAIDCRYGCENIGTGAALLIKGVKGWSLGLSYSGLFSISIYSNEGVLQIGGWVDFGETKFLNHPTRWRERRFSVKK